MKEDVYHFIGIGGIGMSALARLLKEKGKKVQGSDLASSSLVKSLQEEGIQVYSSHDERWVGSDCTVVFSSDIKEHNPEYQKAKTLQLPILHRSDLLQELMKEQVSLLVTGTHGKTTTTALLSSVLVEAEEDPSFVVGGIVNSFGKNARLGKGKYFVAEADESDGSFLKGNPFGAIITNLEREHMNYWKTEENLYKGFATFGEKVESKDHLFWCMEDDNLRALSLSGVSYGFQEGAYLRAVDLSFQKGGAFFSVLFEGKRYEDIFLSMMGRHNVLNALAVFGLCLRLHVPESKIRQAFSRFQGTKRRQECIGEAHSVLFYDDYGHHPTEIRRTLEAFQDVIQERRLVVVFQPHRYSRTQDLLKEFGKAFCRADRVIITDIYGSSEKPIEGVHGIHVLEEIKKQSRVTVSYCAKAYLPTYVSKLLHPHDVLLTMGAGDITSIGRDILKKYQKTPKKMVVGVVCGGRSPEHEVSLSSAKNVIQSLDPSLYDVKCFGITKEGHWIYGKESIERLEQKETFLCEPLLSKKVLQELLKCHICVPVLHGTYGEDGMVQGFLDTLGMDYVGCDYMGSALCMNKAWLKYVARAHNIPTTKFLEVSDYEWKTQRDLWEKKILSSFTFPLYVKPLRLGSSIGISCVKEASALGEAMDYALHFDTDLMIEEEIKGQEIEFSVLGCDKVEVSIPGEIMSSGEFYDYDKKYGPQGMGTKVPASISEEEMEKGRKLAERMYRAAGCQGLARVDFFYSKERGFLVNEINPMPGFTSISLYPKMWEASGLLGKDLMNRLVVSAMYRSRKKKKLLSSPQEWVKSEA